MEEVERASPNSASVESYSAEEGGRPRARARSHGGGGRARDCSGIAHCALRTARCGDVHLLGQQRRASLQPLKEERAPLFAEECLVCSRPSFRLSCDCDCDCDCECDCAHAKHNSFKSQVIVLEL